MSLRYAVQALAGPSRPRALAKPAGLCSARQAKRSLPNSIRAIHVSQPRLTSAGEEGQDEPHIQALSSNPEISSSEARDELRWIRTEVRERARQILAKGRLPDPEHESISNMVQRRARGEPLQYILGNTEFGPLSILCQKPVLIPRPETAHIFTALSEHINSLPPSSSSSTTSMSDRQPEPIKVLDLCTGSGCIALLLSHLLGEKLHSVQGVDNSPAAIALASANIQRLKASSTVAVKYGNIFSNPTTLLANSASASKSKSEGGKVALVVSNPPYIPYEAWQKLPASVREHESPTALLGDRSPPSTTTSTSTSTSGSAGSAGKGNRGLRFYERIAEILPDLLLSEAQVLNSGWRGLPRVALEVGHDQAQEVERILLGGGLIQRTEVWDDQYGVPRMVVGWT